MPNWQSIEEAYGRLVKVREAFEGALSSAIANRNDGAVPALEVLAGELEHLARALLAALGSSGEDVLAARPCLPRPAD